MEMQSKSRYVKVPSKESEKDNDDLDYDDYNLDELNSYDGFAGVIEINIASNENTTNGDDLLGAANINPV